jgi:hypothetical protein
MAMPTAAEMPCPNEPVVMSTPGVVVDGKLVHSGGVPGPDLVRTWIRD